MARHKGPPRAPRQPGKIDGPWEPLPKQLEWYRQWTEEATGLAQIARESKPHVTRQTVHEAVNKVAEFYRMQCHDQIMEFRDRQTAIHEKIARDSLMKFYEPHEVRTVTETSGGESPLTTVRTEVSNSNVAYLKTSMEAMKAIREIWGVNAPIKTEDTTRHPEEIPELPMMNGYPSRAAYLRDVAKAINGIADRSEAK